jgi:hypothetical protein
VPPECEFAIRVFYLFICCRLLDTQNLIVVLFPGLLRKSLRIFKFRLDSEPRLVNFLRRAEILNSFVKVLERHVHLSAFD